MRGLREGPLNTSRYCKQADNANYVLYAWVMLCVILCIVTMLNKVEVAIMGLLPQQNSLHNRPIYCKTRLSFVNFPYRLADRLKD